MSSSRLPPRGMDGGRGEVTDRLGSTDFIDPRGNLRADCSHCQGLCCVAPAFARSADFAIDKPAARACPHLGSDSRCGIHADLRKKGFPGCIVFDCFGAGQQVVQVTFSGQDWRHAPDTAASMFASFNVIRQVMELRWYLAEALESLPPGPLRTELIEARVEAERLVDAPACDLEQLDMAAYRARSGQLLSRVSDALREDVPGRGRDRVGEDLTGAKLRGAKFVGVSLRGAYLLGADLRDADLTKTDLLGADLRAADVRGARLADSLFLTQPQLAAAVGDSRTSIPKWLSRPTHWSRTQPLLLRRARKDQRRPAAGD